MKYFILAGEASGDLHGANLVAALKRQQPQAEVYGWGGEKMQASGAILLKHYKELAFMGFWEVVMNLRAIAKNLQTCKKQIRELQPHCVVLIDYPGFNLRIAKFALGLGVPVYYYISPKVWAWKSGRIEQIRQFVRRLYVIFPFEVAFYQQHNLAVTYVGNPLNDAIAQHKTNANFAQEHNLNPHKKTIAMLPGSRLQEINKILPTMLRACAMLGVENHNFVVAHAPNIPTQVYEAIYKTEDFLPIFTTNTYQLLENSQAAMVTSGTATLETALFGVPQVVCYKANKISIAIGRLLVKIKYMSLVNIIAQKSVVAELLQEDCSPEKLTAEMLKIMENEATKSQILADYAQIKADLGNENTSEKTANEIIKDLGIFFVK